MTESEMRRAIARKRDGDALDGATYAAIVAGSLAGEIGDAQCAAFLMACVLRGMTFEETYALTAAFVASGETLVAPDPRTVDKHSSGGVADTASLVVVPLVAACGVPRARAHRRHARQTRSDSGRPHRSRARPLFRDRRRDGLRDRGAERASRARRQILLRVTRPDRDRALARVDRRVDRVEEDRGRRARDRLRRQGRARRVDDGRTLAETLVRLTQAFGRRALALVTDMDEPLGPAIGTGLEAIEARDFLNGSRRDARLSDVCLALGSALLRVAGFAGDPRAALGEALESGRAAAAFDAMLRAQGAVPGALAGLAPAGDGRVVRAERSGFVGAIDTVALGESARDLVAAHGPGAGLRLRARIGTRIGAGDALADVYGGGVRHEGAVRAAFALAAAPPPPRRLFYGEIDAVSLAGVATAEPAGVPGSAPGSTLERR
jgi:thymidine phosphorylase